jgi:hypothetical protein
MVLELILNPCLLASVLTSLWFLLLHLLSYSSSITAGGDCAGKREGAAFIS